MTRVFKNRAEAEAAGYQVYLENGQMMAAIRLSDTTDPAIVRTDLEAQLADCLTDWLESYIPGRLAEFDDEADCKVEGDLCPACRESGCIQLKIRNMRAALKAFRGEAS